MKDRHISETVFLTGEAYFTALLTDIGLAKTSIDLETYIFDNDALGQRVADALAAAAKRGVRVRVLVDGAGSIGWGGTLANGLEAAGVEVRIFHPFPWHLWRWPRMITHLPRLFKSLYFIFQINTRNHRKVCIIDNSTVFIGSANISLCHLSVAEGGKNWRDTVVKLIGVRIDDLRAAFLAAWHHTAIQDRFHNIFRRVDTRAIIRLNNTRHRRRVLYKDLLRHLSKCRKRVWITNAYFVPDNRLLKTLLDLAEGKIDVRILLPQKSDIFIMSWASSAFYERLLAAGVRIFEYFPGMLHAKSLILDDWFMVGSSNLNHRSLLHDLEVDVNVRSRQSRQMLMEQFIADLAHAKEIQLSNWYKRPWHQKLVGRLILYIKYWI
ncbi:MAG TPA: phospholipase D-like domain-containing protein [Gammaproteobacteria bacterium]|nr:phospholipase D-like domain-containing protein [Gammaproteobacteria bacterium]